MPLSSVSGLCRSIYQVTGWYLIIFQPQKANQQERWAFFKQFSSNFQRSSPSETTLWSFG
jgi:hypothetical protein